MKSYTFKMHTCEINGFTIKRNNIGRISNIDDTSSIDNWWGYISALQQSAEGLSSSESGFSENRREREREREGYIYVLTALPRSPSLNPVQVAVSTTRSIRCIEKRGLEYMAGHFTALRSLLLNERL